MSDIDSGNYVPPSGKYPQGSGDGWEFQFSGWSSSSGGGGGGGSECPECSIYQPVSLGGWAASDPVSLGAVSLGTVSLYGISDCVSIMSVEHVSIHDGRPYNALEMIAKLRAYSINSCGEIDAIGPQEEISWDFDCAPCSLGYDEMYDDEHQVSLGDARCVSYDQMVDVSIGVSIGCPNALRLLYKTRAIELNSCGEIDSVSEVTEHAQLVQLDDQSYYDGDVTVVTDTKTELTSDSGEESSITCTTAEYYDGYTGDYHSHEFTLDVMTITYTKISYKKTKTFTFVCGRLDSVSEETDWVSTNTETWTTQSISCSGGNQTPQCDCDPNVSSITLELIEPHSMDPQNGQPIYTTITLDWLGYPDCTYESSDGSVNLTFDPNANGMNGSWVLALTPNNTAGLWNQDIDCGSLIGAVFFDSDDPFGITEASIT
jgi:hypothetical protein